MIWVYDLWICARTFAQKGGGQDRPLSNVGTALAPRSTIHIVRPLESRAETQPQRDLLRLSAIISQYWKLIGCSDCALSSFSAGHAG
jgi:hypothetical protein